MLDDRAADYIPQALPLQLEALDQCAQCGHQQILVALARVGTIGTSERYAAATDDSDPSGGCLDQHGGLRKRRAASSGAGRVECQFATACARPPATIRECRPHIQLMYLTR